MAMINLINKTISKYTGLLIRMDDICENMNWKLMDKCELLFDKYKIKVISVENNLPDDQDFQVFFNKKNFVSKNYCKVFTKNSFS